MKAIKRIYLHSTYIMLGVLLLLMIAGSIWDLPISKFLYPGHENSFGQFFAAFGELPAFLALSCAGALLLVYRERINPSWSALIAACGAALIVMGLVLTVHEATDNVAALPTWVALVVALFTVLASGVGVIYYARAASAKTVLRFCLTLVMVSIGTMLLINIIKVPWGRARMRLIALTGNESYFSPWWQAGSELKKKLVADGVSSDEFRSFPSGHTACAACAMLLALLPTLKKGATRRIRILFAGGCLWCAVTAFTRLQMGAHFLTDVTMAWLIALGMCVLSVYLFYFNQRFFGWLWTAISEAQNPFSPKKSAKRE